MKVVSAALIPPAAPYSPVCLTVGGPSSLVRQVVVVDDEQTGHKAMTENSAPEKADTVDASGWEHRMFIIFDNLSQEKNPINVSRPLLYFY